MHTERNFEKQTVVDSLITMGGYQHGSPKEYDQSLALFPSDVIAFIKTTQPELYNRIEQGQGSKTESYILKFLTNALANSGTLNVLRHGFNCYGKTIKMAHFAPNTSLNSALKEKYDLNILKVTQQVVTEFNERPDLVISINGIPVVTIELKNQLSATGWNVEDAIIQYKGRNPNGNLFKFKTRTLVHFAVDTDLVYMTTRLNGEDTYFLPFNRGHNGGAGNPREEGNVRTFYLWEQILAKDSLMDIIQRFIHLKVEEKKIKTDSGYRYDKRETIIFPRYHQLDCVRKLTNHARSHGAGHNYLIQHSAGSGKSNSIAWLAYHLSSMHNEHDEKVFDATIVVTDRVVLDKQLQDTIMQFEHKAGVVAKINQDSHQLAKAIVSDTQIIITTIQKFPFVMGAVQKLRDEGSHLDLNTHGKKFAIIVDEAHSSQSGETATELRKVLNHDGIESAIANEFLEDSNSDDNDSMDMQTKAQLYRETHKRQRQPNLSFFAFTATPKWKTLALFDEPSANGKSPFHTYTMKQAIDEGFIHDVLQNYTTYKQYFKLLNISQEDKEVVKNKAKKQLLRFVNLHHSVISQKVEIIIEHFREVTKNKIGGRAKAMLVTGSRESAVRYKLAFDEYIKEKGYSDIKSLVAFSGKIALSEAPEKEYTEVSLNNGIQEKDLVDKFDTDEYQVLLVAEKYQTGFDQPLLHTMFVDKKLSGVQAVQTLSRLNRTAKGKEDTFILDFVNTKEDIYAAFKPYYEVTNLGNVPDEFKLEELVATIDEWNIYNNQDINDFANIWFKDKRKLSGSEHKQLNSILDRSKERFETIPPENDLEQQNEKKRLFKSQVQSYLNLYQFVSQIIPYADTSHERRYVYLKALLKVLPKGINDTNVDLSKDIALQFYRLQKIGEGSINLKEGKADELKGSVDVGTGKPKATDHISAMINEINDAYGTEFTPADQLFFDQVIDEALQNESILEAIKVNNLDSFTDFIKNKLLDLFLKRLSGNEEVCNTVMNNEEIKSKVASRIAKQLYISVKNRRV